MRFLAAVISGLNGDYPARRMMTPFFVFFFCLFFSFVWMGICLPYLIALPHFSGPVSRRYQAGSIYMEIKAFAGAEYN